MEIRFYLNKAGEFIICLDIGRRLHLTAITEIDQYLVKLSVDMKE